jgi:hypothetical protein
MHSSLDEHLYEIDYSANRPVIVFNAAKLHGKFTFNSSQLTIKLIDIYNFL